jgi:hypothetical protein
MFSRKRKEVKLMREKRKVNIIIRTNLDTCESNKEDDRFVVAIQEEIKTRDNRKAARFRTRYRVSRSSLKRLEKIVNNNKFDTWLDKWLWR